MNKNSIIVIFNVDFFVSGQKPKFRAKRKENRKQQKLKENVALVHVICKAKFVSFSNCFALRRIAVQIHLI